MTLLCRLGNEIFEWTSALIGVIPGAIGRRLRGGYYGLRFCSAGRDISIGLRTEMRCPKNISVGDHFNVDAGCFFSACGDGNLIIGNSFGANGGVRVIADCGGSITIGDDVIVGPNVVIRASNHRFADIERPIRQQGHVAQTVRVGSDVWIGANAVILPGVVIGNHAVVAAGAVVSRDVPEYAIVAGVPAQVMRDRRVAAYTELS